VYKSRAWEKNVRALACPAQERVDVGVQALHATGHDLEAQGNIVSTLIHQVQSQSHRMLQHHKCSMQADVPVVLHPA
jgi:hypothetical protein